MGEGTPVQWEYVVDEYRMSYVPIDDMNKRGLAGWEFVFRHTSAACYQYYYKRRITP